MENVKKVFMAAVMLAGANANADLLTDLDGVTTSAGSCYQGCGNAPYDHSNIIDHDLGGSGNTGLNSWNSGFWGGYVQIDFQDAYVLDRIELYGGDGYFNPYTLSGSLDGTNWFTIANGGYHLEPALSQSETYAGIKYGAVHDVTLNTLGANVSTRFLRYSVNPGSPHWGYLFELRTDGHLPAINENPAAVPEPASFILAAIGLGALAMAARKRRRS